MKGEGREKGREGDVSKCTGYTIPIFLTQKVIRS